MDLRFAVIDIGSNAVRFQVNRVVKEGVLPIFKKIEYIRFPLRLGDDVFSRGMISPNKEQKFYKLMQVYLNLMDLYEVNSYMACATSAMRNSKNGREIVKKTKQKLGLEIKVIDGEEEAYLINKGIQQFIGRDNLIHIDVGGGSTEVNIYTKGEKVLARSFELGTVRSLKQHTTENMEVFKKWIQKNTKKLATPITAIGTGGNINKLYDLGRKNEYGNLSFTELQYLHAALSRLSYEEKMIQYRLNEDRADVIVPAANIYLQAMHAAVCKEMIVPKVGLREGMMYHLHQGYKKK